MKHLLFLVIVFSFLFSSCATTPNISEPTLAPSATPIPSLTPTITTTPLPIVTATLTLSSDTMIYHFDPGVSPDDQALIKQGILIARYYLINNYGSDIKGSYLIRVLNDLTQQGENQLAHVNGAGKGQVLTLNVAHHWWKEYDQSTKLKVVVHEFTHLWQSEQGNGWPGCLYIYDNSGLPGSHNPMTRIMVEGNAEYTGLMAAGLQDQFLVDNIDPIHLLPSFDNGLNSNYLVMADAINLLLQKTRPTAFTKYCTEVGQGKTFETSFKDAFGISSAQFVAQFKDYITKSASVGQGPVSTGHAGQFTPDSKYGSLTPLIDYSLKSPNLIIKITDQQGRPVPDINLQLFRMLYDNIFFGTSGEDNGTNSEGILSAPVLPGIYGMTFCAAGYPGGGKGYSGHPTKCVYELNTFDVLSGQTKTVEFTYRDIQDHTLSTPNLLFTLLGTDGLPLANQYLQVCGYDAVSTVCLNGQTDKSGIFSASLKSGMYLIRLVQPGWILGDSRGYADPATYGANVDPYHGAPSYEYEIRDIKIETSDVKSITYQFPVANLRIKFLDANGSPTPLINFYLCKSSETSLSSQDTAEKQTTNEILSFYYGKSWDSKAVKVGSLDGACFLIDNTDKHGNFQLHVDPGKYFIYFDNPGTGILEFYFDHMLSDIVVADNQVTTVSAQFK
jgi:hypothetical protein